MTLKKFISTVFLISSVSLLIFAAGACQKSPVNGDLDGHWQVIKVTPEPEAEIITTRMYMGFYLNVCQLYYVNGGGWTTGNMHHEGNRLTLDFPYALDDITAEQMLSQYGINSNPVSFDIVTLTKDRLVLRDGGTTVELRKF